MRKTGLKVTQFFVSLLKPLLAIKRKGPRKYVRPICEFFKINQAQPWALPP